MIAVALGQSLGLALAFMWLLIKEYEDESKDESEEE